VVVFQALSTILSATVVFQLAVKMTDSVGLVLFASEISVNPLYVRPITNVSEGSAFIGHAKMLVATMVANVEKIVDVLMENVYHVTY